jgi:ribosome-binding factor A
MTRRQEQLNSQILELLSTVIQTEMQDPRLQMLTITRVQVNRDASHAMIFFMSQDDEVAPNEVEQALTHAKGFLRGVLAETLDLRYTPDLTFRYDKAAEETQRVMELFDQIARERAENPPRLDETGNE